MFSLLTEKKVQKSSDVNSLPGSEQTNMSPKQVNAMAVASPPTNNSANQKINDPKDTNNGTKKQL
jgi:hypothetical protein